MFCICTVSPCFQEIVTASHFESYTDNKSPHLPPTVHFYITEVTTRAIQT